MAQRLISQSLIVADTATVAFVNDGITDARCPRLIAEAAVGFVKAHFNLSSQRPNNIRTLSPNAETARSTSSGLGRARDQRGSFLGFGRAGASPTCDGSATSKIFLISAATPPP